MLTYAFLNVGYFKKLKNKKGYTYFIIIVIKVNFFKGAWTIMVTMFS